MQKPYRRHKTSAKISALRSLLTYNYMNTRFQTKAYISNSKFQIQPIFQELFKPKHLYSKDYFRLHENISNQIFFKPKTQEHNISKYISNFQLHTPANTQTNISKTHFETDPKSPNSRPNNHIHNQKPSSFFKLKPKSTSLKT